MLPRAVREMRADTGAAKSFKPSLYARGGTPLCQGRPPRRHRGEDRSRPSLRSFMLVLGRGREEKGHRETCRAALSGGSMHAKCTTAAFDRWRGRDVYRTQIARASLAFHRHAPAPGPQFAAQLKSSAHLADLQAEQRRRALPNAPWLHTLRRMLLGDGAA